MTKILAAVLGLFLALGLASTASAYPVAPPDASVSNPVVEPGQTFTFFAEGFRPGSTVTITVTRVDGEAAGAGLDVVASGGSRMGAGVVVVRASAATQTYTRVADGQGRISLPLQLGATGTYEIVASGINPAGEPFSVSSTVQVVTDASGSGSGSDSAGAGSSGSSGSNGSSANGSSVGGSLARTGIDNAATIAWAAFGVLVLGGLLVAVASGRGRTDETA